MTEVLVGIGSNIDRERNIASGVAALRERFGALHLSTVWNTAAVGFDGADFLNLAAAFETGLPARAVADELDAIEDHFGRSREAGARAMARTLDLDLLLYGDAVIDEPDLRVPRPEILEYAFVLAPLAELAPARRHPVDGRTFAELWAAFAGDRSGLRQVDTG